MGGIVGTLDRLANDLVSLHLLDFGAGVVGTALGAVIAVTQEAIDWIHANMGPGGTLGVISGVVVFAAAAALGAGAGAALIFGTVAGVATGAVTNALINSRPLFQAERDTATKVFGDTIPYDQVMLTNLSGLGGRAFTAAGVDGKIYCNLGGAFANPLDSHSPSYPAAGQLLIHELTHAWQIAHTAFLPGLMCSGIVNQADYLFGDHVYQYGPAGPAWFTFNLEQQAAIVDQWFGGGMDQTSPYYHYIRDNILSPG